jgi:3',5'-cyclic-AMP phosphodiesterase
MMSLHVKKIVQITDTHFAPPGQTTRGLDMTARLSACLADVVANHSDAAALIVTGDLADAGDVASYQHLQSVFAHYNLPPVRWLLGNVDDRANFKTVFPSAANDENGFVQWRLPLDDLLVLGLDTKSDGVAEGRLCEKRLAWIEAQLESSGSGPVLLAMHHHLAKVYLKRADEVPVLSADELWQVLAPHRGRIRLTIHGHTHTTISGNWHGIPFAINAGIPRPPTNQFDPTDADARHGEPAYAVMLVDDGEVVVHQRQIREFKPAG